MIEKLDYSEYLSIDNGKGILLSKGDAEVLKKYHIEYDTCSDWKSLLFFINEYLECGYSDDLSDLEEVLIHLSEMYYYGFVKK